MGIYNQAYQYMYIYVYMYIVWMYMIAVYTSQHSIPILGEGRASPGEDRAEESEVRRRRGHFEGSELPGRGKTFAA